jgi:hypothetical protein
MRVDNERGATLVLVALAMFGLLGVAALAVDAAAAFAWRTEAQKIADASALAGGSAFMDVHPAAVAVQPAQDRAYEYALQHTIKGEAVDSSEVTVVVIPDSLKVRVGINRTGLPTWFARIFGVRSVDIGAIAAAQAETADAARCLKPIAVPDAWFDDDDDTDGDNVWDDGEAWDFDPDQADYYKRYDPQDTSLPPATGYGSSLRGSDRDWGRPMQLKAQNPQSEFNPEPGIFLPWRLPLDDSQEACSTGGGGGGAPGAATYRQNLCTCNDSQIELFQPYDLQPGNMVGPTFQGIDELIDQDPTARWDENVIVDGRRGGVVRPNGSGGSTVVGTASPRVVKMALFDPTQINTSGMQTIEFNNFALFFIEEQANNQAPVQGRFMYFVGGEGTGDGEGDGTLVRYLRLVE